MIIQAIDRVYTGFLCVLELTLVRDIPVVLTEWMDRREDEPQIYQKVLLAIS